MKSTKAEVKASPPVTLMHASTPEVLQWEAQQIDLALAQRALSLIHI